MKSYMLFLLCVLCLPSCGSSVDEPQTDKQSQAVVHPHAPLVVDAGADGAWRHPGGCANCSQ